jgi:branched-chain amino acid aminotransferase
MGVEERLMEIDDLIDGIDDGRVSEVFAAGTAAIVSPVGRIAFRGRDHDLPEPDSSIADGVRKALTDIQYGRSNDPFGWSHIVVPATGGGA